jgi:hypothetical protein
MTPAISSRLSVLMSPVVSQTAHPRHRNTRALRQLAHDRYQLWCTALVNLLGVVHR